MNILTVSCSACIIDPYSEDNVRSLWVGNVNPERVTESQMAELFGRYTHCTLAINCHIPLQVWSSGIGKNSAREALCICQL